MEVNRVWGVSIAELDVALRAVEPAALLVPGRILRRVIKQDRRVPGAGLRVPHRKTYAIARDRLLAMVDADEIGIEPTRNLPATVLLIARPDAEKLGTITRPRALAKYWRLLFHARMDASLERLSAAGKFSAAEIRRRIEQLGTTEFAEIAAVLRSDEWLLPPDDDRAVYLEFVAVFFELRYFAPRLLPDYFPSLRDFDAVEESLGTDVNPRKIFEETRLTGAPEPGEASAVEDEDDLVLRKLDFQVAHPRKQSERKYCRFMDRADRARTRGNMVSSAMLRIRAALVIGPKLAVSTRIEGRADLERLALRLQTALDLDQAETEQWSQALAELLPNSIRGLWTPEARLLYDIQKVCIDHERGVYSLDLVSWALSLGRRPVRRPLPSQREVLMSKHLHAAAGRLRAARLPPDRRRRLSDLLASAVERAEHKLRETLGPRIAEAFDSVNLRPANVPETVARRKLIEELLDTIVDRGFITIGNLRDAVSRNNLKIRDVASRLGAFREDQLLQADRRLAELLDGVYRRGEVYLRLPQILSSLAFGTPQGRFLTRYVFLPYGGAFLGIEFLGHIAHSISYFVGSTAHEAPMTPGSLAVKMAEVLLLGTFVLGLLHRTRFRQAVVDSLRAGWRGIHRVAVELPARLLNWPPILRLLASPAFRWLYRYVLKPLLFSAMVLVSLALVTRRPGVWSARISVFLAMNLLLNSRLGRDVDEVITDWVVRGWHQLRIRVFAAFFRLIIDTFSQLLEALERLLYSVDEWLRFRQGDLRIAAAFKAVLGVAWFFVAYVVRFCVTLLIEPQVNPIKHFPVVTVSHKLLLPLAITTHTSVPSPLASILLQVAPVSVETANALMLSIVWGIPGIFGFLAWELKENWRIFAANRPTNLQPVMVGYKGETMGRLLRPGFHSGTIPKLFARLRRADRKAYATGHWIAPRKYRDKLRRVHQSAGRFVQRELLTLLELTGAWRPGQLVIARLHLGLSSIRVEIAYQPDDLGAETRRSGDHLVLEFDERTGWLIAQAGKPDWVQQLSSEQEHTLATAVTGLFKLGGVDLVRDQVESALGPIEGGYRFVDHGLLVWPDAGFRDEAVYDLRSDATVLVPSGSPGTLARLPRLVRDELIFGDRNIAWDQWVAVWQQPEPELSMAIALDDVAALPRAETSRQTEAQPR